MSNQLPKEVKPALILSCLHYSSNTKIPLVVCPFPLPVPLSLLMQSKKKHMTGFGETS